MNIELVMHFVPPMAGNINTMDFSDMTPFSLADSHKLFEEACNLHLHGK
jgi:hypothetical protein